MSLADWVRNEWIQKHTTSAEEIASLLGIVERDIRDSGAGELSPDWRFNIAYNACLQAANAALYAAGYRPTKAGGNQHYRSLQSLGLTIGASKSDIAQLELFRKKRNVTEYEQSGTIADADIEAVRSLAERLSKAVRSWIDKNHPSLGRTAAKRR